MWVSVLAKPLSINSNLTISSLQISCLRDNVHFGLSSKASPPYMAHV